MSHEAIFVFGSNLSGRHGRGAAARARQHHGAVSGKGVGLHGTSYAIPTKDHALRGLPLDQIAHYVRQFIEFAREHRELTFEVTRVGCGLAGYSDQQMAPLFAGTPKNCQLPVEWKTFLQIVTEEGDTYSFGEISGWLREVGFESARTLNAPGPSPLVLATNPGS